MKKKKVVVAMSGGVDSTVAALLLKKQGFEVIGAHFLNRKEKETTADNGCCINFALSDAKKSAEKLNIPFHVFDLSDDFKSDVIDYFINEYIAGCTPNPCVVCNRHIKFGMFLEKALSMGIDYMATGHYAKIEYLQDIKRYVLKRSKSIKKDQTYVLYSLSQEQLSKTLMPLGDYNKDEIRKIAEEIGFDFFDKGESMEICFIPDNNYAGYIKENSDIDIKQGDFVDTKGNYLGKHKGIINYTVGQRKGLGITFGKPVYVLDMNKDRNEIVLGEEDELYKDVLYCNNTNFISIEKLESEKRVTAKIRYNAREADATIYPETEDVVKVVFDKSQRAITPGQSVVFYDKDVVVGGGVITI